MSNAELFRRAQQVIPGGVNSPVRAFGSVGGTPYFVERAQGPYVWDVEGRRYLDYVQSWGASIVGHAHPVVLDAIARAAERGTTYGAPTEREVLLAEAIAQRVDGIEMVRLTSSGTEATMSALRLARAVTGRDRIIKFDGCYHGHSDALLAAGGSGVATLGLSGSAGVPQTAVQHTVVAPYNVVPEVGDDVACVIVEPVAANMGLIPPEPSFLQGLRRACDDAGALLVFDEVITGFRVGPGGASQLLGVRPDMWCFGKVIGGGLPVGAFGASAALMEYLAPVGPVYQAGTLSGNPLATAAGLAVLDLLDDASYETLRYNSERLATGLEKACAGAGVPARVHRFDPLIGLYFGNGSVTDFASAKAANGGGHYKKFFHSMLEQNIALPPSAYEVFFPSLAHTAEQIDETIAAFEIAAHACAD